MIEKEKISDTLLKLYKLYEVEEIKIPQIIPSTSECIGYDIYYPEFTETKQYHIMLFLLSKGHSLELSLSETIGNWILKYGNKENFIEIEHEDLRECFIQILIDFYPYLQDIERKRVRDILQ